MTWAVEHAQRHRRFGRNRNMETMPAEGIRAWARPLGAGGVGMWTVLLAAWGGISVFVGPLFDYRPTTQDAWHWSMQNWLLHLVPGAVGVVAGLMMLGAIGARGGARRGGIGFASLLTMAAGAWFVIGPAAYRWFESAAPFAQTASARSDFINQLGSNLGPGVLLAVLAGMALKAGIANPQVVVERQGDTAAMAANAAPGTRADVPATRTGDASGKNPPTTSDPARDANTPAGEFGSAERPTSRTETARANGDRGAAPSAGPES